MADPLIQPPPQAPPAPRVEPQPMTEEGLNVPYTPTQGPSRDYGAPSEDQQGYAEGLSWGQKFLKQSQSALEGSPIGLPGAPGYLWRQLEEDRLQKLDDQEATGSIFDKLSVSELAAKYPDMPEGSKFTEPTSPRVAEFQYNQFKHAQSLQEDIDFGEHELGTLGRIGAGSAAILDPVNLVLAASSGGGTSLAGVFAKNAALMSATEIPGYFVKKHEHMNPSALELAAGIGGGALIGTGIHYAVPYVFKGQSWRQTNAANRARAANLAMSQVREGKIVDVSSVAEQEKFERAGNVGDRQPRDARTGNRVDPYRPEPEKPAQEKTWWVARDALDQPQSVAGGEIGVPATASREAANNIADREIVQMGLRPESEVVSADDLLSEHPKLLQAAESAGLAVKPTEDVGDLINQLHDQIQNHSNPDQAQAVAAKIFQQAGIDAVNFPSKQGEPESLQVFNTDAMVKGQAHDVDEGAKPAYREPDPTSAKSLISDPDVEAQVEELKNKSFLSEADKKAEDHYAFVSSQADKLIEEMPHLEAVKAEMDAEAKEERLAGAAAKLLVDCETGNIS